MPPNVNTSESSSAELENPLDSPFESNGEGKARQRLVRRGTAEQLMMKVISEAEHVEHAMMNMLHNAWNVCHFNSLPKWLQDNDYLHSGHRPPLASFEACFWSIFRFHTETLNIWTHGVGCLAFVFLSVYLFVGSWFANAPLIDKIMLGTFLTTAILCLAASSCYHTLSCHSRQVCEFFCKLDYCGISLLIAGSIVPCLYYGFYCRVQTQIIYSTFTAVLCAASVFVSFSEKFSDAQYRHLRAALFTSYALTGVFPAFHWYYEHYSQQAIIDSFKSSFVLIAIMATLYITGVLLYALRIPECIYPGKFAYNFGLHSHSLFHIFVLLAAYCHLQGIITMADVRLNNSHLSTCSAT